MFMMISNGTLADFSNGFIFDEETPRLSWNVHTKTLNRGRGRKLSTQLKPKLKINKECFAPFDSEIIVKKLCTFHRKNDFILIWKTLDFNQKRKEIAIPDIKMVRSTLYWFWTWSWAGVGEICHLGDLTF